MLTLTTTVNNNETIYGTAEISISPLNREITLLFALNQDSKTCPAFPGRVETLLFYYHHHFRIVAGKYFDNSA